MTIQINSDHPLYDLLAFINDKDRTIQEQRSILTELEAKTKELEAKIKEPTNSIDQMIIAGKFASSLGIPYVFGAEYHNNKAFDCSSFVQVLYKFIGIAIPRVSRYQAKAGTPVALEDIKKGDLIFFDTNLNGTVNHVAMYIGNGEILHTNNNTENIHTEMLSSKYLKWMIDIRRFIE
jgi:peptidoglycan endopeptidase LytE